MSKPLPSQNAFAGLAPPWSLANLDSNFTNVWNAIDDIGTYSLYVIDTGVVNALQVTISAPLTVSLVDGLTLDIKVANTITSGTPTLQVNALGAKTITNGDGTGLQPNQLVVGGIYRLTVPVQMRGCSSAIRSVASIKCERNWQARHAQILWCWLTIRICR